MNLTARASLDASVDRVTVTYALVLAVTVTVTRHGDGTPDTALTVAVVAEARREHDTAATVPFVLSQELTSR